MKKILDFAPLFLVTFFLIAISLKPEAIGFIIGFVASSCLFAYQQYLFRTEQPDIMAELKSVREELAASVAEVRSKADKELSDLRNDVAKFSLTMTRVPGVMDKPKDKPKIMF
jgi:hypothetical protein